MFALLWKLNCLLDIWWDMSTQSIMQISYKIISVLFIKWHKSSTHHNKLDFINIVTDFLQLFDSISSLNVWVVSGTNGSHWCWFVTCIGLGWVLEITVWAAWAVDANVSCCCDVWASVRLAHYGNHGDSWCCSYGFGLQQWSEFVFIVFRKSTDDVN